jgi:hypothetical protein
MTQAGTGWSDRIRSSIAQWIRSRMQECIRCSGCENVVFPFVAYCSKCGQANPTKISISTAVFLVVGFLLIMLMLSLFIIAF